MTEIMGILNVTPDSFSDGGEVETLEALLAKAAQMLENGADILDIGAESTRPNAEEITPAEEWERLKTPLREIRRAFPKAALSLDTRHAQTAAKGLDMGVDIINDVSGGKDPDMWPLIRHAACRYIAMHSLTTPVDPAVTVQGDAVAAILQWAAKMRQAIDESRLILDVGLGFGKTREQNWELLRRIEVWQAAFPRWLLGHSRKSFLGKDTPPKERDLETHIISAYGAAKHVSILRVHDVAGTKRAIQVAHEIRI